MLTRTDLRSAVPGPARLRATLPRPELDVDGALHRVRPVVEAVRDRGVGAVLEVTEQLDRVRPASIRVPEQELTAALAALDPAVVEALEEAISRTRMAHADQRRTETTTHIAP